jgi:hypothetical protein
MPFESVTRSLSVAVRVVDDLTGEAIIDVRVVARNARRAWTAHGKPDGFHVLTDLPDGAYTLEFEAAGYQPVATPLHLPLPGGNRGVLDMPGENETMLVVQDSTIGSIDSDAGPTPVEVIRFAARDIFTALPAGSPVVSSRRLSTLAATLDGEAVDSARIAISDLADGTIRLRPFDIVRVLGHRVVRLRPASHYPFGARPRRLAGTVYEAGPGAVVEGATVRVTHLNDEPIATETVGTAPENRIQVATYRSALDKRAVDRAARLETRTNARGRYVLYFPERADLPLQRISIRCSAPGFTAAAAGSVELAADAASELPFYLDRA